MTAANYLNNRLSGFIADLPTPFDAHGWIDWPAYEKLCNRQIHLNATAIVVGETMGEAWNLTPDEHDAIVRAAVRVSAGRITVIAGAGSNSTSQAIELALHAEAAGADAILSVVPYYNKPTQSGIEAHFRAIAAATALPIVLHDAPARTAREISNETIAALARSDRFIGLKDTTGSIGRLHQLRSMLPRGFRLLTGDDVSAGAYLQAGGDGCISIAANVAPDLCRRAYEGVASDVPNEANRLVAQFHGLAAALSADATPAPLKYALALLGLMTPTVRLPIVESDEATKARVAKMMIAAISKDAPDEAVVS